MSLHSITSPGLIETSRYQAKAYPWAIWAQVALGGSYTLTRGPTEEMETDRSEEEEERLSTEVRDRGRSKGRSRRQRRPRDATSNSPNSPQHQQVRPARSPSYHEGGSSGGESPITKRLHREGGCACGQRDGKLLRHSHPECGQVVACTKCIATVGMSLFDNDLGGYLCDHCIRPIEPHIDAWIELAYYQ